MLLVATGLKREAKLMARPGVVAIAGGGDAARLEAELDAAAPDAQAIVSSGLAGALDPNLKAGDLLIGMGEGVDPLLSSWMAERLPDACRGMIIGVEHMVSAVAGKRDLRSATGAIAVDMESHIAARVARRHGLPFGIFRVVSDAADHALPPAALVGMRPDGSMATGAVLTALLADPRQLPALIATAISAERGFRGLLRGHLVLRLVDFVQHPLDMA